MSVYTTFDENRDKAKEKVKEAMDAIKICLDKNTWGYDDMREEFIDSMIDMLSQLYKIHMKL